MRETIPRRQFLGAAAAAGLSAGLSARSGRADSSETITVGVMGVGGRGTALATGFAGQSGVRVACVCDVDRRRAGEAAEAVRKVGGNTPETVVDFRRILDNKEIDVLVIATCDHWHAPAAILGCTAGKHVYVEKPCSHNPREGELMVEAARKHRRVVQLGTQRRSWPRLAEGVQLVREGEIGRAEFALCHYNNNRPSIGRGKTAPVPDWLDYDLWQGPAPRRPYRDNILHYNWHWFWHWGTGELGNNGVHVIDLCRWGLGVDYPIHVSSGGGRYRFEDDQETPDTQVVTFDFADRKSITFQGLSCNPFRPGGRDSEIIFYGDKGSLSISGGGYTLHDPKGKTIRSESGPAGDSDHIANFLAAIRHGSKPVAEIEEGYKSTLLCHLGNIAQRTGRALRCDPKNGHILNDSEAMVLWTREYAPGWEPTV